MCVDDVRSQAREQPGKLQRRTHLVRRAKLVYGHVGVKQLDPEPASSRIGS